MAHDVTLNIRSDLDPQDRKEACTHLLGQIADGAARQIEFDAAPNIFALQIALACRRSLAQRDAFQGFGPVAQHWPGNFTNQTNPVRVQHHG